MSRHGDDAWREAPEEPDVDDESRGTIEPPVPVCSVCSDPLSIDPDDGGFYALYCEPCHDEEHPS